MYQQRKEHIDDIYKKQISFGNMYHKLQLIEVVITDLAEKNQCFGKLDDGMSVFVTGIVAIGDIVEAEVYKIKKIT